MPGVLVFAVLRNAHAIRADSRSDEVKMIDGMGNNGGLARNPEGEVETSCHLEHAEHSPAIRPHSMRVGDVRRRVHFNVDDTA